jgi:hypothetical protein
MTVTKSIIVTHHDVGRCLGGPGVLTAIRCVNRKWITDGSLVVVAFVDRLHSAFPHRTIVQLSIDSAGPLWEGREAFGEISAPWLPEELVLELVVESDAPHMKRHGRASQ